MHLIVYSRQGCHLCEILLETLLSQVRGRAEVEVRDVDECDDWRHEYGERVPVLIHDGQVVSEYVLDTARLQQVLRGAGDSMDPHAAA